MNLTQEKALAEHQDHPRQGVGGSLGACLIGSPRGEAAGALGGIAERLQQRDVQNRVIHAFSQPLGTALADRLGQHSHTRSGPTPFNR